MTTPVADPKLIEETLRQACDSYYNGVQEMSDAEFDALRDLLEKLDPKNQFLKEIGAPSNSVWPKVKHSRPMGSLLKVNEREEFSKWVEKYTTGVLCWSEKLDGISLNAVYQGEFMQGVTRGDGVTGDDITPNAKKMMGIVPSLKGHTGRCEIRGEVVFLKETWKKEFQGDKNPRNSVAGACRRLDGEGCEHASFFAYDVSGIEFESKKEMFEWLQQQGFSVPAWGCVRVDEAHKVFSTYVENDCQFRNNVEYEIDGLVFEENDTKAFVQAGERDGRPKAARAYKFPSMGARTTLRDVVWQVGRTLIRPVGILDPVEIGGVTISRVDLCNIEEIERLGAKFGSTVEIFRANDVIPKTKSAVGGTKEITPPASCPVCSGTVGRKGPNVFCENDDCSAKDHKRVMHYLRSLDVKGFGDKVILALCEAGMVRDSGDLYDLSPEDVGRLEGFGEKNALKALRDLQNKSRDIPLPKFIKSLGIPLFGEGMTEKAVEGGYNTLESLREATVLKLLNVEGIGEEVAMAAERGLKEKAAFIDKLLERVTLASSAPEGVDGKLSGKIFVFTGFRSKEMEAKIKSFGGKIGSSVSKKTTHLVVADLSSASGKMQKAKQFGAEILTVEQLGTLFH